MGDREFQHIAMMAENMPDPWDFIACESCGRGYHFHDGPKCGCQLELVRHNIMWAKQFEGVLGGTSI